MKITKDQMISDLRNIGLRDGTHVAVVMSLKSVGFVEGGPDAFIDAVLDVIGPNGTLMMNTFTRIFPLSEISSQFVFDPETTIPWTGVVPSTLMKRKDAIRSRHPAASVVAIGKQAKFLTENHNETVENEYLPYEKIAQISGYYLSIGLNDQFGTILHEAQRRAGLFVVPKFRGVLYKNCQGEPKPYILRNAACSKIQPIFISKLVEKGIVRRGHIGNASSTLSSAKELIEGMTSILRKDSTLNLCRNAFCLECREFERRLNLYEKIRNPEFFQRNLLARKSIELRNRLILKHYSRLRIIDSRKKKRSSLDYMTKRGIQTLDSVLKIIWKENKSNLEVRTSASSEFS